MGQKMGNKLEHCDILHNYWAESKKVHTHNPWLTYAIGIHRLREAGLAWSLINLLDKRPLTLPEIHEFCAMFFLGESGQRETHLPHPQNWAEFLQSLTHLVKKEKAVWNPVSDRKTSWLSLSKMNEIYGN